MAPSALKIAVLILPPIQLLDLSPVDLFHMISRQYLQDCNMPAPFLNLGLDAVEIYYVGEDGPSTPPFPSTSTSGAAPALAQMTASASIQLTHNLTSPAVQPGHISILFVPGPDPNMQTSGAAKDFIRAHADCSTTTLMSVCTGVIPLARAGVLDGRVCTGPRALLGMGLRKEFPKAEWIERRWAVDHAQDRAGREASKGTTNGKGELWTAGGITNGQDMVAAYIRAKYNSELADLVCAFADVGGRAQEYGTGAAVEGMWWGWLLVRSWLSGLMGGKTEKTK